MENSPESTVAIITHGGMIHQLYHGFLRRPVEDDILIRTGDTGIHEWRIDSGRRIIIAANRLSHLDGL